jgi:hypothetical protein
MQMVYCVTQKDNGDLNFFSNRWEETILKRYSAIPGLKERIIERWNTEEHLDIFEWVEFTSNGNVIYSDGQLEKYEIFENAILVFQNEDDLEFIFISDFTDSKMDFYHFASPDTKLSFLRDN